MTYRFTRNAKHPERIDIHNPTGQVVAWVPQDAGMMIAMMYQTAVDRHGATVADEMAFGYCLGLTHALLYQSQLPTVEVTEDGATTYIRMIDKLDGEVMPRTPSEQVPGAGAATAEMLDKGGLLGKPDA